tara:strand:+ start:4166 stop:4672 length:507 start_codon:yes stop_codon:yes gene_type:complete
MNNVRYSANLTRQTNNGISMNRRPLGKGSRATSYNNLIRTNFDELSHHVENIRFKFKQSTHAHGTDRWYLEDNGSAHTHNLEHFLYLSELLQRKQGTQPALPTLVEFIIFMIAHPSLRSVVGVYRPPQKISAPTPAPLPTVAHDLSGPSINDSEWGDFSAPQFDDDEL